VRLRKPVSGVVVGGVEPVGKTRAQNPGAPNRRKPDGRSLPFPQALKGTGTPREVSSAERPLTEAR
jgi:hypothetical protein